jgi:hypothetical protein
MGFTAFSNLPGIYYFGPLHPDCNLEDFDSSSSMARFQRATKKQHEHVPCGGWLVVGSDYIYPASAEFSQGQESKKFHVSPWVLSSVTSLSRITNGQGNFRGHICYNVIGGISDTTRFAASFSPFHPSVRSGSQHVHPTETTFDISRSLPFVS